LSYEAELLGLALLLYLYDSSALLYSNEAMFSCNRARRWSVSTGWAGFTFAGRTLCILNPFTPHHPAFRLAWDVASIETPALQPPAVDSTGSDRANWSDRASAFDRLLLTTWLAWIALFVMLPVGLFTAAGAYVVVPALVLLYGSSVVGLWRLRRSAAHRPADEKRFVGFAFECLACPPFAANMIRRITLQERIAEPVPLAGIRLLDAERWDRLRTHCANLSRDTSPHS
jgi:hypothetical protein